jgi:AraC family transcriptional activator of pobA
LIFVSLSMTAIVELETFYKSIQAAEPDKNEVGHFNIFRIEDILTPNRKQVTYSRRSFFKVSLITGHNKLHYADKCIEIQESALVFTNPMIPYYWERISEKQVGFVCIFTEAFFSRFGNIKEYPVFQFTDAAIIPLTTAEVPKYTELFARMFNELQEDYIYKYDLLRNLLMEIVHRAQKMQPASWSVVTNSNASERIASMFNQLLERQFPIELSNQMILLNSPSAFAKQLNVHVNHLNKALKEITGHTTSQLINERLLQEAKILLKSTNWTIAEIAWSLGFEEPNHFSSFFKNRAKITPKNFRQSD